MKSSEVPGGVQVTVYVGTYRWTDAHGDERGLDIFATPAGDPRVAARTADSDAATVATVNADGHAAWSPEVLEAAGLDTAAARNDLIEACRQAYVMTSPARSPSQSQV